MKATGIVRRIDNLGRVVIPKEIRRTMRIREGDPLEIFTDKEGGIVFRKYSQVGELTEFADTYAETISKISGLPTAIIDKESVIAVSGVSKKDVLEKNISLDVGGLLEEKITYDASRVGADLISLLNATDKYTVSYACPVVCQGESIGAVVLFSPDGMVSAGEAAGKVVQTSAAVLGKIADE